MVFEDGLGKFYDSIFDLTSAVKKLTAGVAVLAFLQLSLSQFPWTRVYSHYATAFIGDPLSALWSGVSD